MGYAMLLCSCINCRQTFTCNPVRVPSIRVRGEKEPLCRACAEEWIRRHPEAGFVIPADAYEPCEESELD